MLTAHSTRINSSSLINCQILCWRNISPVHNVETYGTGRQVADDNICVTGRTLDVCCVTKATDTHSEYLILVAIPRQTWLRKCASISPLYVHCLSCILTCYQGCISQIEGKKRKFPLAEPKDFRNEAGKHGSKLSMSFSRYKSQDDVATVSLYVVTHTHNIPLDIHVLIKEV